MKLFKYQDGKDYAVVNGSDTETSRRVTRAVLTGRLFPFALRGRTSVGDAAFIEEDEIVLRLDGAEERYQTLHIKELTNLDNAMAAATAARLMGAPRSAVRHVLDTFSPLPHRVERVRKISGVTFVNDSKATNVGATLTALTATEAPIVLISGGVDKGGDYKVLIPLLSEKVRLMVVTGEGGEKMKNALSGSTEIISADNFDEAVKIAASKAKENETVLLSPACSSFDEFSSFVERGERFRSIVEGVEGMEEL
jgi:UDP-N-acetylmuramoylalanine--D-glutamate ligase